MRRHACGSALGRQTHWLLVWIKFFMYVNKTKTVFYLYRNVNKWSMCTASFREVCVKSVCTGISGGTTFYFIFLLLLLYVFMFLCCMFNIQFAPACLINTGYWQFVAFQLNQIKPFNGNKRSPQRQISVTAFPLQMCARRIPQMSKTHSCNCCVSIE